MKKSLKTAKRCSLDSNSQGLPLTEKYNESGTNLLGLLLRSNSRIESISRSFEFMGDNEKIDVFILSAKRKYNNVQQELLRDSWMPRFFENRRILDT
jgi:hypothetical protein